MNSELAFAIVWGAWLLSWFIAAAWASRPEKRPSLREEAVYRLLTIIGALMMFWRFGRDGQIGALWIPNALVDWLLWLVALGGLAFTWWARIHLGTLWSGNVTRKPDHHIIDTGPYGLVRHPIYTGLLVALYATALDRGSVLTIAGAAVLTLAFAVKARLEERFLGAELGAEIYGDYRRRVPMLVPFWPIRRSGH